MQTSEIEVGSKKFYEAYFENANLYSVVDDVGIRVRRRYVQSCLDGLKNKTGFVVDLGCGIETGLMDYKGFDAIRLDYAFKTLVRAKQIASNIDGVNADAFGLPFIDNSIEVIVSQNVLEHLEKDQYVIDEIYRVLKPGGYAILSVPAGLTMELSESDKLEAPDHFRKYTKDYFEKLIQNKFTTEKIFFSQKFINTMWLKMIRIISLSHSVYKRTIRYKQGSCYYDWWVYKLVRPLLEGVFWRIDNFFAKKENNLMAKIAVNYSICIMLKKV